MALLDILCFPDPRLRNRAEKVTRVDDHLRKLARDMLETMYSAGGIGLAATQVNVTKRVVAMDVSEQRNQPIIFINPEILDSEGSEEMQEGCLSVPEYYAVIQRAEKVQVGYLDLDGTSHKVLLDGLQAVCIQHEIDHLNGKLFIDYLSPLKRQRLQKKLEKQTRNLVPAL